MLATGRAGFVLVGGASSRMGTNKAFLPLDGQPLVLYVAKTVASVAGSAMLVGSRAVYGHLGLKVIPDARTGYGPLAGIEAALDSTAADFNLIVACDLPGLSAGLFDAIFTAAEAQPEADITMPAGPEPLCAVYRKRALPLIRAALDRGTRKVTDAFDQLLVQTVAIGAESDFTNVNTPDDWRRYTQG